MSPSPHQRNARGRNYDEWPEKLVAEKNEQTLLAVIKGSDDPKTLQEIARAEGRRDKPRRKVVGSAYRRIEDLNGGGRSAQ